jgi:hypothetical protein
MTRVMNEIDVAVIVGFADAADRRAFGFTRLHRSRRHRGTFTSTRSARSAQPPACAIA